MADKRVTAALVVIQTRNGVQHLHHGDIVPAGILPASLANLESLGFIETVGEDEPTVQGEPVDRPAESGPGSSKEKWTAYAEHVGVTVPDGASREDIVTAVTNAGH